MIRRTSLPLCAAALLLAAAVAAPSLTSPARAQGTGGGATPGSLDRYDSDAAAAERGGARAVQRARADAGGLAFAIGVPAGWTHAWGGARTRFYPADEEGAHAAATFVEVTAVPLDEPPPESHLFEPGGLLRWLEAARPRLEVEDQRRVKVGAAARACEAVLAKDPAQRASPDRRELVVLVPSEKGAYVLRLSAPLPEFSSRDALWKRILESFEPK